MKLCWILPDIGRYHHIRANAIAGLPGHEIHLVEISDSSGFEEFKSPDTEKCDYTRHTLSRGRRPKDVSLQTIRTGIANVLGRISPDVVFLNGWSDRGAIAGLLTCIEQGIPRVLIVESTLADKRRYPLLELAKRRVVRHFQGAFVSGVRHRCYTRALGLPDQLTVCGYAVVDNDHFSAGSESTRREALKWRAKLQLPAQYFLAVARLVPEKNISSLLVAYARYKVNAVKNLWHLVLAGDGPLRARLSDECGRLGIAGEVVFLGFKRYEELPLYYALAGALIHPARTEPWGLVVNEAMAAGLAVLVSDKCGCVPELVHPSVNGFSFNPDSVDEMVRLMQMLAEEPSLVTKLGRNSSEIVKQYSPSNFASKMSHVATLCLASPVSRAPILDRLLLWSLMQR